MSRALLTALSVAFLASLGACGSNAESPDEGDGLGAEALSRNSIPELPTGRTSAAAAVGPDGRLYVIGGHFHPGNDQNFTTVEAYSPSTNTWTEETPLPTSRQLAAAVAGRDGLLYVIGGNDGVTKARASAARSISRARSIASAPPSAPARSPTTPSHR